MRLVVCVSLTVGALTGCSIGQGPPPAPTSAPTLNITAITVELTAEQAPRCSTPPMSTHLAQAVNSVPTGVQIPVMPTPQHMLNDFHSSPAEVLEQKEAWDRLSEPDRVFNLCLDQITRNGTVTAYPPIIDQGAAEHAHGTITQTGSGLLYTVASDDDTLAIASRFNIQQSDLRATNCEDPSGLQPDQRLHIRYATEAELTTWALPLCP